jgi:hypothetical protein
MKQQANTKAWSENTCHHPGTRNPEVCLLLQSDGPILEQYQDHGQMINNAWYYCAVLEEELKCTIHNKHGRMMTNGVVLYCDNS